MMRKGGDGKGTSPDSQSPGQTFLSRSTGLKAQTAPVDPHAYSGERIPFRSIEGVWDAV